MSHHPPKEWTAEDSANAYNLKGWALKYFAINAKGNLVMRPRRSPDLEVDMKVLVDDVAGRGIKLPVLFRFQDILRHRVAQLNETFKKTIDEYKYKGRYFGVYPIKVNQLREVVEEIVDAGEPYHFGLEAGSKGELIAVLAMNGPDVLTIVNGYKDESMLRLALIGVKLGKQVIVVVEKPSEIDALIRLSREMAVRPLIGLRGKLQSQGTGPWKSSGGDASKFGLTTPEILEALRKLREAGLADCVKLLHFHIGSQVTDIQAIKDAVKEASRIYAKLRKMDIGVEHLDCGGGLAVDYDGTHTSCNSSTNYTLKEYVEDIVYTIQEVCSEEKVPEPHIVTESGRALVAHHSVLVVNVFGSIEAGGSADLPESSSEHKSVADMRDIIKTIIPKNLAEAYHDALQRKEEAATMFKLGLLSLEDKAKIEILYWQICREIKARAASVREVPDDLLEMFHSLNDQYLCNFSLFQSLPDSWAIGHLFPIMPLHRLNDEPGRECTLVDITCDSDGKVDQYVGKRRIRKTLPLHPLTGEPYYLGIFLMGAYQATMGDIHNLFGRVNEVHVFEDADEPGGYYLEEVIQGQTVREVLASIQYSDFELVKMLKTAIDAQVKTGSLKPREGVDLLNQYEAVLQEYTYVDHNGRHSQPAAPNPPPAVQTETPVAAK